MLMTKYHSLVFMSKFFLKSVFTVCSFLSVSFSYRINLDNCFLVSCVDLLKTKSSISVSKLWVDHCFVRLEMNIFLFQLEFSSFESTEAFTKSSDQAKCFSCWQKSPIIPLPDLRLNFLLKWQYTKTTISLQ